MKGDKLFLVDPTYGTNTTEELKMTSKAMSKASKNTYF
jgi:hypothetical protein